MISSSQSRAARALLNLHQRELADAIDINITQVSAFERGTAGLSVKNINKLSKFFTDSGIEFMPYDGVRFSPSGATRTLIGKEGLQELYDDIFKVAQSVGGAIDIFNGLPDAIINGLGKDWYAAHLKRMKSVKEQYVLRAIVRKHERHFIGDEIAEYRWWNTESFQERTIYVYGSKVAFITFEPTINIILIDQQEIAESQRALFDTAWLSAEVIQ